MMVCHGKSHLDQWFGDTPHFRKPPFLGWIQSNFRISEGNADTQKPHWSWAKCQPMAATWISLQYLVSKFSTKYRETSSDFGGMRQDMARPVRVQVVRFTMHSLIHGQKLKSMPLLVSPGCGFTLRDVPIPSRFLAGAFHARDRDSSSSKAWCFTKLKKENVRQNLHSNPYNRSWYFLI